MIKNYIKIAFRSLFKNKVYSFINIFGLALGMTVSMLILMFVVHEFSFDKFHQNHKQIYRIMAQLDMDGRKMQFNSFTPRLGPAIKSSSPGVKDFVRIKNAYKKVVIKNPAAGAELFYEPNFMFTDPSFFKVFSFKLKEGNVNEILTRPFTMVISERMAEKYFGDKDPIGKALLYEGKHLMEITGVAENPPSNSTFNFDFLASSITIPQLSESDKMSWEKAGIFNTYLLLDDEKSVPKVTKNILAAGKQTGAFDESANYILEQFATIHLGNNFSDSGNTRLIYIFAGIAVMILFLALFNYMSLTTARSTLRAKEVGVRKVSGAGRGGLIRQFYVESVLVCLIAFALSFLMTKSFQRPFYELLNLNIDTSFLISPLFISIIFGLLLLSAFFAGSYPALILSGFSPMEVLKGRLSSQQKGSGIRKGFTVFQFTVSIALIISTFIVKDQLNFMQQTKLGFNKDQVISIPLSETAGKNFFALRNEIAKESGVEDVTVASTEIFKGYNMYFTKNFTNNKDVGLMSMSVDQNFVKTFQLEWKTKPQTDSWKNGGVVLLNEKAVLDLGFKGNPVGQQLLGESVSGIIKDAHFNSLQSKIEPLAFFVVGDTTNLLAREGSAGILYAKVDPKADLKAKVEKIEAIYKKYEVEKPFEYYFLDDAFNETFKTEIRMSKMFTVFTAFAIFIACMGLFGLVTFTAEIKTKEIGIRKVLGASVSNLVVLLSKDFIKLVLIANGLAFPLAWYMMDKWLQDFTYKTDISWTTFTVSGTLAIVIALVTVSFQAIKAALMDPVESLKSE
ncbi:FtsX-like permease family protein [Emticicia sp. CRIBPO]|uniref:ABC transporter permease n=1 Tax=Emticicia sp. CRIBPO TaxID=2683258 RepID=UPI001411BA29|nr:ABC transporter permease [Emticicia sp. CRIBPO]NBA85810.1 FtsX-like permease family protein [Emticicia sp. CRIBPO]